VENKQNNINLNKKFICALIVLYNPKIEVLKPVIKSLENQVDKFFIYDNSDNEIYEVQEFSTTKIEYISVRRNIGIAAAQNKLIEKALLAGYKYLLLSDQDTVYPSKFVEAMMPFFQLDSNTVAIVPNRLDVNNTNSVKKSNTYIFDKNNRLKYITSQNEYEFVSHSIASGMIIKAEAFSDIGVMNDDLFIDWVDNEWCWRAIIKNYNIIWIKDIVISHTLGDKVVKVFNKNFVKRSKIRNYYIVRNALFLVLHYDFLNYNKSIKSYLIKKVLHHFFYSIFVSEHKFSEALYLGKAIKDAVIGKLGKLNEK